MNLSQVIRPRRAAITGLFAAVILGVSTGAAAMLPDAAAAATTAPVAWSAAPAQAQGTTDLPTAKTALSASPGPVACPAQFNGLCDSHGCPDGYFCAYPAKQFEAYSDGCGMVFGNENPQQNPDRWFDWAAYSGAHCSAEGDPGTWSWDNNGPYRVWKQQTMPPSSNTWCISPNVSNSDVGDNATRTDGWIQLTTNTAACPPPA